jgi:hypothetical protein
MQSRFKIIFLGWRPKSSYEIHTEFSGFNKYPFKFSSLLLNHELMKKVSLNNNYESDDEDNKSNDNYFFYSKRPFVGMNP